MANQCFGGRGATGPDSPQEPPDRQLRPIWLRPCRAVSVGLTTLFASAVAVSSTGQRRRFHRPGRHGRNARSGALEFPAMYCLPACVERYLQTSAHAVLGLLIEIDRPPAYIHHCVAVIVSRRLMKSKFEPYHTANAELTLVRCSFDITHGIRLAGGLSSTGRFWKFFSCGRAASCNAAGLQT